MIDIKVGDRITGNKTGDMFPSTVIGILPFRLAERIMLPSDYERWNECYPNFREEYVIFSKFDEPCKTITREELKNSLLNRLGHLPYFNKLTPIIEEMVDYEYEHHPLTQYVAYPIADVEVLSYVD